MLLQKHPSMQLDPVRNFLSLIFYFNPAATSLFFFQSTHELRKCTMATSFNKTEQGISNAPSANPYPCPVKRKTKRKDILCLCGESRGKAHGRVIQSAAQTDLLFNVTLNVIKNNLKI